MVRPFRCVMRSLPLPHRRRETCDFCRRPEPHIRCSVSPLRRESPLCTHAATQHRGTCACINRGRRIVTPEERFAKMSPEKRLIYFDRGFFNGKWWREMSSEEQEQYEREKHIGPIPSNYKLVETEYCWWW